MGKAKRAWLSLLVLAASAPAASAIVAPSFSADACTWHATHIVVVAPGKKINGLFEVKESWKGCLEKGDRINVPDLARFARRDSRAVSRSLYDSLYDVPRSYRPRYVTCSRMVLFLKGKPDESAAADPSRMTWVSANPHWKYMQVSVAWIERGETYAFHQHVNPGPSLLVFHGRTDDEMRADARRICEAQEALTAAVKCPNPALVAEACRKIVRCESWVAEVAGVDAVARLGQDARPVMRHLLKDESLVQLHPRILGAMARVGGREAAPDLTAVVEQDLAFWKKASRRLRPGWHEGKGLREDEADRLQARYSRTDAALSALQGLGFGGCRKVVTEFRDFWRSRPQFKGLELDETCQSILDELARPMQRPKSE
jgi:hypothetical protein